MHDATPRQADQLEPALRRVFDDGTSIHDLEMHGDEPTATSALIDMLAYFQTNRDLDWVKKIEQLWIV